MCAPCKHKDTVVHYGILSSTLSIRETRDKVRQVKDPETHTELHQCHTVHPFRVFIGQDTPPSLHSAAGLCPSLTCTRV